jgi:hypothetical protein
MTQKEFNDIFGEAIQATGEFFLNEFERPSLFPVEWWD